MPASGRPRHPRRRPPTPPCPAYRNRDVPLAEGKRLRAAIRAHAVLEHVDAALDATSFATLGGEGAPATRLEQALKDIAAFYEDGRAACVLERLVASPDRSASRRPLAEAFGRWTGALAALAEEAVPRSPVSGARGRPSETRAARTATASGTGQTSRASLPPWRRTAQRTRWRGSRARWCSGPPSRTPRPSTAPWHGSVAISWALRRPGATAARSRPARGDPWVRAKVGPTLRRRPPSAPTPPLRPARSRRGPVGPTTRAS